jgi:hypothetical protein
MRERQPVVGHWRHGRSKDDDHTLRRNTWPGLALAGGVVIAALLALLLIGGGGPGDGWLPNVTPPSDTRLFPADGDIAGDPGSGDARHGGRHRRTRGADVVQYGLAGGRGTVLGGPGQQR